MPISKLDSKVALIIIDLQKGITSMATAHDSAGVIGNSAELAKIFRHYSLPVILVNVTGGASGRTEQVIGSGERPANWSVLVPELNEHENDIKVTKKTWGAFHNTPLDDHLKKLGTTQVVITGIATSAGVESTARSAHEHGYNVVLAVDAMTDMNKEAHDNSVQRIFPRIGETGTTQDIIELVKKLRAN